MQALNSARRGLVLEEAVQGGDNARGDVVDPDAGTGALVRVRREERSVVWVCFFEVFEDDGGFVERLGGVG